MTELSKVLEEFDSLLEKKEDSPKSLPAFNQFLRYFLRTKTTNRSLPSIEVMTVLKHRKPVVFTVMKKESQGNAAMNMLTRLEMNIDEAIQRLEILKKEKHHRAT
jgi:hypothetical protein